MAESGGATPAASTGRLAGVAVREIAGATDAPRGDPRFGRARRDARAARLRPAGELTQRVRWTRVSSSTIVDGPQARNGSLRRNLPSADRATPIYGL
jgi:hypothetical protein